MYGSYGIFVLIYLLSLMLMVEQPENRAQIYRQPVGHAIDVWLLRHCATPIGKIDKFVKNKNKPCNLYRVFCVRSRDPFDNEISVSMSNRRNRNRRRSSVQSANRFRVEFKKNYLKRAQQYYITESGHVSIIIIYIIKIHKVFL